MLVFVALVFKKESKDTGSLFVCAQCVSPLLQRADILAKSCVRLLFQDVPAELRPGV